MNASESVFCLTNRQTKAEKKGETMAISWPEVREFVVGEIEKQFNQIPPVHDHLVSMARRTICREFEFLLSILVNDEASLDPAEVADDNGYLWSYEPATQRFWTRHPLELSREPADPVTFIPPTPFGPGVMNE